MKNKKTADTGQRLLDLCILLLILLSVAGVFLRGIQGRNGNKEGWQSYEILGVWKNAEPQTARCLKDGDLIYTEAGALFGQVLSVMPEEAAEPLDGEGEEAEYTVTSQTDVRLRVRISGRLDGGLLYLKDKEELCIGQTYRLCSDLVTLPLTLLFYPADRP